MKIFIIYLVIGIVLTVIEYITIHFTMEIFKTSKSFRKDKYELIKKSKTKLSEILKTILWVFIWPVKVFIMDLCVYIGYTILLIDTKKFHAITREMRIETYNDCKESA